jgi:type IV pilus biogenesis protein CpaD/CtpE
VFRCSNRRRVATLVTVIAAATLAGCAVKPSYYSNIWDDHFDRRETISAGANDAVAANQVAQMVDPWPAAAANHDFPTNGERVVLAIDRYRTGQVIQPTSSSTSTAYSQQQAQQQPAAAAPPAAAPVK